MLKDTWELKLHMLAEGMRVSKAAEKALTQEGKRPLTLAEYATTSGIPLELPGDVWVNAPFIESFCRRSKIVFDCRDGSYFIAWKGREYAAKPCPVPAYFDRENKRGVPYTQIGVTHTDRIRISPIQGCSFRCKFCDLNRIPYGRKEISDLIDVVEVAVNDEVLPAKHGIISGGTPLPQDREYLMRAMREVTKAVGIPMDAFIAPWGELEQVDDLYSFGIDQLSVNIELWNKAIARRIMPDKAALGRERYLEFIERAVDVFGKGKVRSIIMVGLEPMSDLLKGVEALAKIGCNPVLSPFRPSPKTPLARQKPPTVAQMRKAYEESKRVANKYKVSLGPACIPCHHNTLTFPEGSKYYRYY